MNKRLRKKLHKKEFQETGFEVKCVFHEGVSESSFDQFIDDFLTAIEEKSLVFGGGGSLKTSWEGIISKEKKYTSPDSSDKNYILDWLKSRSEIREYSLGRNIDLWYPPED
jgi:uncharacterized protein YggL (DUF469 family)